MGLLQHSDRAPRLRRATTRLELPPQSCRRYFRFFHGNKVVTPATRRKAVRYNIAIIMPDANFVAVRPNKIRLREVSLKALNGVYRGCAEFAAHLRDNRL